MQPFSNLIKVDINLGLICKKNCRYLTLNFEGILVKKCKVAHNL